MSTTKTIRKKAGPRNTAKAAPATVERGAQRRVAVDEATPSNEQAAMTGAVNGKVEAGHELEQALEALSVDHQTAQRIQKLPRDIGWLLVTAGIVGVVMPGVLGVPFLALGGLILLPATNQRAERWLAGHSPKIFRGSIRQINRFLDDLERRYPRSFDEK